MLIYCLYASVGFWYKQLGVDEFLDRQYDAIFHTKANRSAEKITSDLEDVHMMNVAAKRTPSSPPPCSRILPARNH